MTDSETHLPQQMIKAEIVKNEEGKLVFPNGVKLDLEHAIKLFRTGKSPLTVEGYTQDWKQFAEFLGAGDIHAGAEVFFKSGAAIANALLLSWRNNLIDKGLATNTINRKITAVKSLTKIARMCELCNFVLDVDGLTVEKVRDLKGDGYGGFLKLLEKAHERNDAKGIRDQAIFMTIWARALRRVEITRLNLEDWDQQRSLLFIHGKKRRKREPFTIAPLANHYIERWVNVRGDAPGALFHSLQPNRTDTYKPLHVTSMNWLFNGYCEVLGLKKGVHRWRHASITHALDVLAGNIREVQVFARHSSPATTAEYDDARKDFGGATSAAITADLDKLKFVKSP